MLTTAGHNAVGSIQHDGVRYDSNSLTPERMREVLEIPAETETPDAPVDPPAHDEPAGDPDPADAQPDPPQTQDAAKKTETAPSSKKQEQKRERYEAMERRAHEAERALAKERDDVNRRMEQFQREMREELARSRQPEQPKQAAKAGEDVEPKLDDFADQSDPYAAWMRATAKYDARQEWNAQQAKQREQYQQYQSQQREQQARSAEIQRLQAWTGRMEAAFANTPELRETVESMPVLPRPMMDVVIDSEIPDQLIHHLLQHPDEQARISALPSAKAQFREMARIEYQLEQAATLTGSAPTKPKTNAHPPVSPVSGSHAAPTRTGEPGPNASYEEHKAYWNAREAEERRSRR